MNHLTYRFRLASWALLTVLLIGVVSRSAAQVAGSASLSGTIRDEAGAQIAGASVVLTEVNRQLDRNSTTNDAGRFVFPNIPAGAYSMVVTKPGFESYRLNDIRLSVDQQGAVEAVLKVGAVTTSVDVSATQQVLLETESNTIGTVVDSERVMELPLNGRNPLQLALLASGANDSNNRDFSNNQTGRSDRAVVIGGNFAANTSYLLNGIVVRGSRSTELTVPLSPDAVDQFRVQQSFFMPDQGPGPAIVNFATKGGGNAFHGSVYEFLRNEDLDARNFFSPPVPDGLHRNQFGFTAGGPIRKNRIWFFGLYEGYRQATAFSARAYTPTSAMFSGNFQAAQVIYDPLTFDSQTGTRTPFANNVIPSDRINPVSQKLLQYYLPGASLAELPSNVFVQPRNSDTGNQYGLRIDASLTPNQTLFGQVIKFTSDLVNAGAFPASGSFYPADTGLAMLQHTWTISPTLVSTTRFGITRNSLLFANQGSKLGSILPGLGVENTNDTRGVSGVSLTGYSAFGHASGDLGNVDNVYQLDYGLYSVRGKHNLQFGANLRYYRSWQHNSNASALGALTFQSLFTAQLQASGGGPLAPVMNTGNSFADFLLGTPATAVLAGLPSIPYRATEFLPYVTDTWKVTRSLTLNYGISWFKATVPNPVGQYRQWPHGFDFSTGLLTYAALGQVSPEIVHAHNLDFTPRLGFAWQPAFLRNTVIRGGAGIYYADYQLGWTQWGMLAPPYSNSASLSNVGLALPQYVLGQNVFPTPLSSALPTVNSGYAASLKNAAPFLLDPNARTSYMEQWNLTVQRTLRQNDLLELLYMGSSDHDLLTRYDVTQCRPSLPNLQCLPSTRLYSQYTSLLESLAAGNSSYEAIAARFDHRMTSGLNARFEYTVAKALTDSTEANNPQIATCRACEKGSTSYDVRQRAVLSLIYDLPFGRRRQFGATMSRAFDAAAGGWTVTAIASFQTGIPIALAAANLTGAAYGQERPNRICNGNDSAFSGNLRTDGLKQFDTSCFASPASGYFGNSGWNVLTGPGVNNWDIGIQKYFNGSERLRLQFRAEMFNAFNHAQFGLPDGNVADAGFGLVSAAGSPRLIQLALKLLY